MATLTASGDTVSCLECLSWLQAAPVDRVSPLTPGLSNLLKSCYKPQHCHCHPTPAPDPPPLVTGAGVKLAGPDLSPSAAIFILHWKLFSLIKTIKAKLRPTSIMYLHLHSTYLYNIRKSYYLILVSLSLSSFLATPRYDLLLRAVFDPRAAARRVLAAVIIFLLFQI